MSPLSSAIPVAHHWFCRLLALSFYPLIRFEALVLVEPMIVAHEYTQHAQELLLSGVTKRQDRWPSQQAAYLSLQRRRTWKAWDDRVLQAFVVCTSLLSFVHVSALIVSINSAMD